MNDDLPSLEVVRARLPRWARDGIMTGLRGSMAHGTYTPPTDPSGIDDVDVFSVVVHPRDWYLGLESLKPREGRLYETAGETVDILVYDVQKFMNLVCKGNPNVHFWLWNRPENYLVRTRAAEILITNRRRFLSNDLLTALAGYAAGQLARMTKHRYEGYMGQKRKALVDALGYDAKNAAHCLRLLVTGIRLLETGDLEVQVDKLWRQQVIDVKHGRWTMEKVKDIAGLLFDRFNNLREVAQFDAHVDRDWASRLLVDVMEAYWDD